MRGRACAVDRSLLRLRLPAFCCFFSVLFFLAVTAHAAKTYTVRNGDNLYRLSKKFDVPASELKDANRLGSDNLSVGMKLTIPGKGRKQKSEDRSQRTDNRIQKAKAEKQKAEEAAQADKGNQAPLKRTYTVKKGDNIYRIAKRFDLNVSSLKEINGLKDNSIKPGQKLLLAKEPAGNEAEKRESEGGKTLAAGEAKSYIVKKGDNIYRIAKKFDVSVASLKEINGLQSNSIKPGQKLFLSQRPEGPQNAVVPVIASYDEKNTPAVNFEKLKEVKELSGSVDLSDLSLRDRVILFAKKMLHLPYRFGGTGAVGLDCSAYVQKVYGLAGFNIPRSAREQFQHGDPIDKKELSIGDLVFFRTYASFPSHVGIYLGNNLFIHASSISKKITIDSLDAPYYFRRFIGAKRLLPEEMNSEDESDQS